MWSWLPTELLSYKPLTLSSVLCVPGCGHGLIITDDDDADHHNSNVSIFSHCFLVWEFIILTVLLPSSAAPFAPRYSPPVVLSSPIEPWLTVMLKQVCKVKGPLKNITQHTKHLTEILSRPSAIWTLCSLILLKVLKVLDMGLQYQTIHIKVYIMSVNMVYTNAVAFKLTPKTINTLVKFQWDVYSMYA